MTYWNSDLYLKFEDERTRPAVDLVNAVTVASPSHIIDLGCGPGNSTVVLYERFPDADLIGVDNSPEMIDKARLLHPELNFQLFDVSGDLSAYEETFDIVFSNACIQWIPDHAELLPRLMSLLKKNGILAVQIPFNYNEPIHRIIREVSSSHRWHNKFTNCRNIPVLSTSDYFNILSGISVNFRLWHTVYYHRMSNHDSILDLIRSTGLRPYLSRLSNAEIEAFESDILSRIREEYPVEPCGRIIYPFPRLFFLAQR